MRHIRFTLDLILLFLGVFLVLMGFVSQVARGAGMIIGSIAMALLVIELFFFQRHERTRADYERELDEYIKNRFGFDYHKRELLDANDLSQQDIAVITQWFDEHRQETKARTEFWTKEFLDRIPPIGMDWASGYTPTLDMFSRETKEETITLDEHFFFSSYKKEIELSERVLAQNGRNNVLLVGEEGVGQEFILRGLERLIESGRTLPGLSYKRFIWLNDDAVLSGVQNQGQLRERLQGIFKDVLYAGNIVLGIERIDSFFDPAFPEIADSMIPFLQSDRSQVVATITPQLLATRLNRSDVVGQFAKVAIEEPSLEDTLVALQEVAFHLEEREHLVIPYPALKKVVELADRFAVSTPRPQKDIDLLQEVVSFAKSAARTRLEVPDVLSVLSQRSGIPLGALGEDEKQKLLHLEDTLHKRLIDQKEAVSDIAKALKRARIEVRDLKRPIGSFLFLGPTGVGKTTAAKALAQLYFGHEDAMVRFDLSEFQKIEDTDRLIDALSIQIKQHPYSLLLLDEIEKAHSKILNLFLQILDEGILTDMQGTKIDFRNLIIIATSNAGAEFIRTHIENVGLAAFQKDLLDHLQEENIFSPEFLNRFDAVVTFKPLGSEELKQIANLLLEDLAAQLKKEHNVHFVPTGEIIDFIATKGFSAEYGARPMRRVLQDTLETLIADRLLSGQLKKGDTLTIRPSELEPYAKV